MPVRPVVALAGGVGAARFLEGLVQAIPASDLTVIVNTGDDRDFFGLRVCPDLDIVTYTLAGRVRRDTGWGLEGDTFQALDALRGLRDDAWFQLGDRDLATHIHRSARLAEGAGLAEVTAEIAERFGVGVELLPMTEDPAPTVVVRNDGRRTHFEEYLVRDGSPDDVASVDLSQAERAEPAPGVIEAIRGARTLLLCPSNPVVSIGPIRAVRGVEAELQRRGDAVAVSPIVGGRPVKGPADRLLRAQGTEVSARGVAGLYAGIASGLVIDQADAGQAGEIESLGLRVSVLDTLMTNPAIARSVAEAALALAETS
ncbi:MAG: 2-phospho-L-lactate transferase [Deltaproteobacteria bacterium]|nr:2-phospho-L-lactate transferase [Deltaproteobacteria bacterium]MBW2416065.1 2-phospho-L-lactate transferase [Deltaproteobacteria bacterium]